jgi:hypothetical protein
MKVSRAEEGLFMELEKEDGKRVVVSLEAMFDRIWDDFIRGNLTDEYTRGMFGEMGLSGTEIFHLLEQLQVGRSEFEKGDYRDVSYI